jgi:hypothetical protein
MNSAKRLVIAPAIAVAFAGLSVTSAHATATEPLSDDAVDALALASCQLDPETPLTLDEMHPTVVAEADVEVVPDEISAHVVSAEVFTRLGDVQQCTFGVLHRDAQLKQVVYEGTVTLDGDGLDGTVYTAATQIELGNMGKSSPIDSTTEVALNGFVAPLESLVEDPTYTVSVDRKSIEVVQIAVHKAQKDAAARLLAAQTKAADRLLKKQTHAAEGRHADKAIAAAHRAYDKRIAAAKAAYTRATTPKTISRPVTVNVPVVTGSVTAIG